MTQISETAAIASIGAAARELRLPTLRAEAETIAGAAAKQRLSHLGFLAEVLSAEVDDRTARRRVRRIAEARFPRLKRLSDFDLDAAANNVTPQVVGSLATGSFIETATPVVFLGDSGTGKSHLLIGT